MKTYIRTCQECGKNDSYPPPPNEPKQQAYWRWAKTKCKHCKSPGLDHGSWVDPDRDNFYTEE